MSFSSKRLQTTSSSKPSKYIQTSNELSLSTKGLQPSNPSNLMTGSVYTSNQNSNLNHHVLSGNGNNNSGPDHAYGPEVINHGFEWTDDDYDHFIDCIIEFKGHIPSSRTVIKKWMDIRTSFMAYVRRIRPHLNYNPEWQDLQKSYKMNRKEFAKEFDIKFNDVSHLHVYIHYI